MTINNWRNFCIWINEDIYISLGQEWDDETNHWQASEVALFVNGQMVGDPVRFTYFDGLSEIVEAVKEGDYKIFERHYIFEPDLFDNDN